MVTMESEKVDRAVCSRRWILRLLVGGVIAAIGTDLWVLFRRAIEEVVLRYF